MFDARGCYDYGAMNHPHHPTPLGHDPATCAHGRVCRIGIQKSPFEPRRLYLVTCLDCGTTVTTISLRKFLEERGTPPRSRRKAG